MRQMAENCERQFHDQLSLKKSQLARDSQFLASKIILPQIKMVLRMIYAHSKMLIFINLSSKGYSLELIRQIFFQTQLIISSIIFFFHDVFNFEGDVPLKFRKCVFQKIRNPSFQVSVRNIDDPRLIFIHLFQNICPDKDLPSHHSVYFRVRIVKGFGSDIDLFLAYFVSHRDVHEVTIRNRPYSLVLHVQNFSHIFFVENFQLHQLVVELAQRVISPQKINHFFDGEGADMSAFGCNPLSYFHFVLQAWVTSIFNPILGLLQFSDALDDVRFSFLELQLQFSSIHDKLSDIQLRRF